jgi:Rieske Fe-S protein
MAAATCNDILIPDMLTSMDEQFPIIENRRGFLSLCAGALAGITIVGIAAPLLQGCEPSMTAPAELHPDNPTPAGNGGVRFDISSLDADGKSLVTARKGPDGKHILLVRQSATTYLAVSMSCTHQGCEVDPPRNGVMTCPCHGSQFDLSGTNLAGPAPTPLKRYEATFDPVARPISVKM